MKEGTHLMNPMNFCPRPSHARPPHYPSPVCDWPPPLISSHVRVTYKALYHQVLRRTEHTCSVLFLPIHMQNAKFSGVKFLNMLETAFYPIRTRRRGALPPYFCECGKNVFSLCRWHAINRCVRLPVSFPRYDERAVRHA